MSVEFIGMIETRRASEIHPPQGPTINPDYLRAFAQAHEHVGFDGIPVAHHSTGPVAFLVTAHAGSVTERIGFMPAHRPRVHGADPRGAQPRDARPAHGRTPRRPHHLGRDDDDEQGRDGDFLSRDERYARTDEYVGPLRRV